MIVITGPGRSGTSLIAAAYHAAGVECGGEWSGSISAGYEDPDVVQLNRAIAGAMGGSLLGDVRQAPRLDQLPFSGITSRLKSTLPENQRYALKRRYEHLPWNRHRHLALPRWERLDQIVARFGPDMRQLATRPVAKDPQFCLTLPAWLRSGGKIDHVVLTTRNIGHSLQSRTAAHHLAYSDPDDGRNSLIYAVGLALVTLWDSEVPYTLLRFPEFVEQPDQVAATLPLPDEALRNTLQKSLRALSDPNMVRAGRQQ